MGRPRKWASDAERKASKRTNQIAAGPDTQDKRTDLAVNGHSKRTEIEPPSKRTHENNYTPFAWHLEIDQSREESLIKLHKDATRYRWLRLNAKEIVIGEKGYMSTYDNPESLDKTIDERL